MQVCSSEMVAGGGFIFIVNILHINNIQFLFIFFRWLKFIHSATYLWLHMLGIKIVHVCRCCFCFLFISKSFFIWYLVEIAVSLGKNDIRIYNKVSNKWKLTHTLCEHLSRVLAIDWAPKSNQIVSSSAVRIFS